MNTSFQLEYFDYGSH